MVQLQNTSVYLDTRYFHCIEIYIPSNLMFFNLWLDLSQIGHKYKLTKKYTMQLYIAIY